jgi:chorismate-pyruvate lyase
VESGLPLSADPQKNAHLRGSRVAAAADRCVEVGNGPRYGAAASAALKRPVDAFSERVRDTDSFTRVVAEWLGCAVRYQLLSQIRGALRPREALTLDVPPGSAVLERRGLLWAPLPDGQQDDGAPPAPVATVVADVRSVVLVGELTEAAERALDRGDTPLGEVFAPRPVRRHTHAVVRTSVTDGHGSQALRVLATLTVSGRPVATVEELVYQQLLDNFRDRRQDRHRVPGRRSRDQRHLT